MAQRHKGETKIQDMNKRNFIKSGLMGIGALLLSKRASALEYYPRPSDKKWAVLYGTWCGSARDAAGAFF